MSASPRVLVPFDLPDADPLPAALLGTLTSVEVLVLGHYWVPEQTPPVAAEDQFAEQARDALAAVTDPLEAAGITGTSRLVYSTDREEAIAQAADEDDCDAILVPNAVDGVDRLFVALRGTPELKRVLAFAAAVLAATDVSVTLVHTDESVLARATDRLSACGIDPGRIHRHLSRSDDLGRQVLDHEETCDLLVLGEKARSRDWETLQGTTAQVTVDAATPTFVVRSADRA